MNIYIDLYYKEHMTSVFSVVAVAAHSVAETGFSHCFAPVKHFKILGGPDEISLKMQPAAG